MTILVRWYERKADFTADTTKEHHGTITGESATECWRKFTEHGYNHDLNRYTRREICGMWD